jgi:hypothetical protein
MTETEEFELRVAAAVRTVMTDADPCFDAAAIADAAIGLGRERTSRQLWGALGLLGRAVLSALLAAVLIATVLQFGSSPTPVLPPSPSPSPSPSPAPRTPAVTTGALACAGAEAPLVVESLSGSGMAECRLVTDDPRLAGGVRFEIVPTGPARPDSALTATLQVDGPDGRWEGRFYGYPDAGGAVRGVAFLVGTAGHEGWTVAFALGTAGDARDVTGTIYPAAVPPGFPTLRAQTRAAVSPAAQAP